MEENIDKEFWDKKNELELAKPKPTKVNLDGEKIRNGLAQLILTVVSLLQELMEKQALRRIENGALDDEQIERLGKTFMALKKEITGLQDYFEFDEDDLQLNLGPFLLREDDSAVGKASVVEILDRLLSKGVVAKGDVVISVADVDLISVNLGLLLASIDKAKELYNVSSTATLHREVQRLREENAKLKGSELIR
jgi:hypothetical protein